MFENTREAAKVNTKLFKNYWYDLTHSPTSKKGAIVELSSDFWLDNSLAPQLVDHIHWPAVRKIINEGVTCSLEEIFENVRQEDLKQMMKSGNHNRPQTWITNIHYSTIMRRKLITDVCYQCQQNVSQRLKVLASSQLALHPDYDAHRDLKKGDNMRRIILGPIFTINPMTERTRNCCLIRLCC